MSKKILLLNGSPRPNGNTEMLSDAFIEGAGEVGHDVKKVNLRKLNIEPCIGCYRCQDKKGNPCVLKDDMDPIYRDYIETDMLVLASPMYYWAFTAQLKATLDRLFAVSVGNEMRKSPPETIMLVVAGEASEKNYAPMIYYYKNLLDWLGWIDKGVVMAGGFEEVGSIAGSPFLEEAKKLGASV